MTGNPETGTKNGEQRSVPMNPALKKLLLSMKGKSSTTAPDERVLRIRSALESMHNAAKIVGIEPLTHHDLRHLFATTCIESGVDIPTVSRWLGHRDGGALAMRVYGHLRDRHSLDAAQKVLFSG